MKTFITTVLICCTGIIATAQPIPDDSLYLGQTPPGNIPVIFNLSVNSGSFAAERIAISDDNKEIYYSEVHDYYPTIGDTIKFYRHSGGNWSGPYNLFQNYLAPALSVSGDTMFCQNNSSLYESYFSVRNGNNWSNPQRLLDNLNSAHYLQVTNNGHYYISSIPTPTTGAADWCQLLIDGTDTTAVSLGTPLNSSGDNLDFFVSKDETFMILAKAGLKISYHRNDGGWTNPKDLGSQINFGLSAWGPYVTKDNKYLFYTTGTLSNYSDTYVYWVRADNLIDSLSHTNFTPYVKKLLPYQYDTVGVFFNYTIPDSTFIDDDGNNTLTYSAKMVNGNPLPAWLNFDAVTGTFYGTPVVAGTFNIRITATDTAAAYIYTNLKIIVSNPVSTNDLQEMDKDVSIFPNPSMGFINIRFNSFSDDVTKIEIQNLEGKLIFTGSFRDKTSIDLSNSPGGIYILKLNNDHQMIVRRVILDN